MNNKYKILFVENELDRKAFVTSLLESNDYRVIAAESYAMAKTLYASYTPDLVLLKLDLPDKDGSELLKSIRKNHSTPVVVLSERSEENEIVRLLDMGANDYIKVPFGTLELLARIRAALRNGRYGATDEPHLQNGKFKAGGLTVDYGARRVFISEKEIHLTQNEYNILAFLSVHSGKMMTYASIIKAIWQEYPDNGSIKKLQVNIANIRKKFELHSDTSYIVNESGIGYRINK